MSDVQWKYVRWPLAALLFALILAMAPAAPVLVLERSIPLPGVSGRIDHMDFDRAAHRLFVAALEDNTVQVVDVVSSAVTARISGLSEPQGVGWVPEARKLYVTNGGTGVCNVYDGSSLALLKRIELGDDADNVHYDSSTRTLFVSTGSRIVSISVADDSVSPVAELGGHPEGFAFSTERPLLFANVPVGSRSVIVVDRGSRSVVHRWQVGGPLSNLFSNFPLALDEQDGRIFVATRVPPTLAVMDEATGARIAAMKIDGDPDDVFLDQQRHRLYVSCGDGSVDVIPQLGPDSYDKVERIPTAAGARTSLWVPSESTLFVAAPRRGETAARILVFRAG